jgi:hypothetical protein
LLNHGANVSRPTKMHKKSALGWAKAMGNDAIIKMINDHTEMQYRVSLLFKAVSRGDVPKVKELIDGGTPFCHNQDKSFERELESKCNQVDLAKQNLSDISVALLEVDRSKAHIFIEMQEREKRIESMIKTREEIVAIRRTAVTTAISNISIALNSDTIPTPTTPSLEYELISKTLCTLFHIQVREGHDNVGDADARKMGMSQLPHWKEIRGLLQSNDRFYHRVRHYHFEKQFVEMAKTVKVDGLLGTCLIAG